MRTSILAGAVIVGCYGLVLMERKGDKIADPDQAPSASPQQEFSEERDRLARLEKERGIVRARIDFARRIARELIARRLTLMEAANELRDLDSSLAPAQPEFYGAVFPQIYPGRSEVERYCQRAIVLAEGELVADPAQRRVVRRLKDEFRHELNPSLIQLSH
jgi:hypothetical protein